MASVVSRPQRARQNVPISRDDSGTRFCARVNKSAGAREDPNLRSTAEFSDIAGLDAPLLLVALMLAVALLYAATIASRLFDAVAREETGFTGPPPDDYHFVDRVRRPEFILLLVTAASAAHGVNWSVGLPLCLAGLSIARLPKYLSMWPRATEIGAQGQVYMAVALSIMVSLVNAISMIAIGAFAGWLLR